jgi:hypothetical protein
MNPGRVRSHCLERNSDNHCTIPQRDSSNRRICLGEYLSKMPRRTAAAAVLVAAAACSAARVDSAPAPAHLLEIPPRFMWGWAPGVSGYCGSVSMQTAGIWYGNWFTEDYVRGTSGGHDGAHQMYISYPEDLAIPDTALIAACPKLKMNCTMWNYRAAPQPQHADFLRWAASGIDRGHPVLLGIFWGAEATPNPDYDHLVPMIGYEPAGAAERHQEGAVGDVSVVYYNDLHANVTTRAAVSDFVKNRSTCITAERFGPKSFCLQYWVNYGLEVSGNLQEPASGEAPLRPVRLVMGNWTEPDYSQEDKLNEPPVLLSARVIVSELSAGVNYALLRFDDPLLTPVSRFLESPHVREKNVFVATAATAEFDRNFMSNTTQLFRCVEVPSSSNNNDDDVH